MRRRGEDPDPFYFEFTGTYHVGAASAGLEFLTPAEKRAFREKEANRVIGFTIPDGKDTKKRVRR